MFPEELTKTFSLLGYPKCGNTWIHHILCLAFESGWSDVFHSHAMPDYNEKPWNEAIYDFGPHLFGKTIVIVRHLGDVLVSLWMHLFYRDEPRMFTKDINSIVNDEIYGYMKYLQFHKLLANLIEKNSDQFFIIRYSDAMDDESIIYNMFKFIDFNNQELISKAIYKSKFEFMKKMEQKGKYTIPTLERCHDWKTNPNGFKVRQGIIGGYLNYFNDENIQIIHEVMLDMPEVYGYTNDKIFLGQDNDNRIVIAS